MPDEATMAVPRVDRTAGELMGLNTRTPFVLHLSLLGCTIRAETNSPTILDHIARLGKDPDEGRARPHEFLWRLVSDPDAVSHPPWPLPLALADGALRLVTFGQCNFIAVDFNNRVAVAFLADELARDESGFRDVFFTALCRLTAEAWGLDPGAAPSDLRGVPDGDRG